MTIFDIKEHLKITSRLKYFPEHLYNLNIIKIIKMIYSVSFSKLHFFQNH